MKYLLTGIGKGNYGSGGTPLSTSNLWKIKEDPISLSSLERGNASNGQVLKFNNSTQRWEPADEGGVVGLTINRLLKATSPTTFGDSDIVEDGTKVDIQTGLQVTGQITNDVHLVLGDKTAKQRFCTFQNGSNIQWRVNMQGDNVTKDVPTDPAYAMAVDSRAGEDGFSIFRWPVGSGTYRRIFGVNETLFRLEDVNGQENFRINMANGDFGFRDGANLYFGTSLGTRIGYADNHKLAFWGKTPVIQQNTTSAAATLVSNTSGITDDTATFDGYTIGQVIKILRTIGLLQ
jgi:uncharacterized lipoprotein YehR (DUF1307 family)